MLLYMADSESIIHTIIVFNCGKFMLIELPMCLNTFLDAMSYTAQAAAELNKPD